MPRAAATFVNDTYEEEPYDDREGTVLGRIHIGSFVLQHHGTISSAGSAIDGAVVPDSATGELRGLRGTGEISVQQGTHHLTLDYELDG